MENSNPYFSIVIPMYNREQFMRRALTSCLTQDFQDFEIIVVDDGSTDRSIEVVRSITDRRLQVICHGQNQGACPARNTGVAHSRAPWVVFLDSDDELLPGALQSIYQRSQEAAENIGALCFGYIYDTGVLSPDPPLSDQVWDYEQYIRALEFYYGKRMDIAVIPRSNTFAQVKYPPGKGNELLYHLNFSQRYLKKTCSGIIKRYNHDAANQLTAPVISGIISNAPHLLRNAEAVLALHGESLARWAPRYFLQALAGLATLNFLTGRRRQGLHYVGLCLRTNPLARKTLGVALLGLLGPRPLAWVKSQRTQKILQRRLHN
jgi:glycosyltransferase involved in cell wall biosynthesis